MQMLSVDSIAQTVLMKVRIWYLFRNVCFTCIKKAGV